MHLSCLQREVFHLRSNVVHLKWIYESRCKAVYSSDGFPYEPGYLWLPLKKLRMFLNQEDSDCKFMK
jgi:hypothetical protein